MTEAERFKSELEQYAQSRIKEGGDPYEVYLHAAAQAMGAWRLAQLLQRPDQGDYKSLHQALADQAVHFQQRERA